MPPKEGAEVEATEGINDTKPEKVETRTAAERRHDEMLAKREAETIAKLATKSHKERIKEMNDYLSKLSEHYDIPRVGPG